ncbi:hypothetical protein Y59_36180 [Enterobacter hormaechei]|nr:hypothetical protein Y59_36180 [Enterobacter hormaechei]
MFFFNQRAKKQGQLEKRSFDKLALAYVFSLIFVRLKTCKV